MDLEGVLDGFVVTDTPPAQAFMSPIAVAHMLIDRRYETILTFSCSNRNHTALQGDLLAAYALGVRNIVCVTGDHRETGHHSSRLQNLDFDSISLLEDISLLSSGKDLTGEHLTENPQFLPGAVFNPLLL